MTNGAATAARNAPGTVTGGQRLPRIAQGEEWLRQTGGNAALVPRQIVDRLGGQQFSSFGDMQSAFWREVAARPCAKFRVQQTEPNSNDAG